jgi:hypothetical protein
VKGLKVGNCPSEVWWLKSKTNQKPFDKIFRQNK